MIQVPSTLLWIGNAHEARDPAELSEQGIKCVVDLAIDELPSSLPRDFIYCRFPLVDGQGNEKILVRQCVQTVANFVELGTPTLIACSAGLSRSPTIAVFAVAHAKKTSIEQVFDWIKDTKRFDIHSGLWQEVLEYMQP